MIGGCSQVGLVSIPTLGSYQRGSSLELPTSNWAHRSFHNGSATNFLSQVLVSFVCANLVIIRRHGAHQGHHVPFSGHEHGSALRCERDRSGGHQCSGRDWTGPIPRCKEDLRLENIKSNIVASLTPRSQRFREPLPKRSVDLTTSRDNFVS
jgi:hypothetical protein